MLQDSAIVLIIASYGVYGGVYLRHMLQVSSPLQGKVVVELSHAEVAIHHEIVSIHAHLFPDAERLRCDRERECYKFWAVSKWP